jgi:hypothetical protein
LQTDSVPARYEAQVKLSLLLDKWLDPACTFWTATDPVAYLAPSATSGAMRATTDCTARIEILA